MPRALVEHFSLKKEDMSLHRYFARREGLPAANGDLSASVPSRAGISAALDGNLEGSEGDVNEDEDELEAIAALYEADIDSESEFDYEAED